MHGAPRSKQFDDVYFSESDGLAETRHVFLDGNGLPAAWLGQETFTICETGFGTGLNFLAAWALFEEAAEPEQCLDFISFEQYPLTVDEIAAALKPFAGSFPKQFAEYLEMYPDVETDRVKLTLIIGDVNEQMPQLEADIDAWFLDGFKPSSNPEMWSDTVFQNMARLSHEGTSLATFTAAGFVRRGLQDAGFEVERVPGFGRKRDMTIGRFSCV